MRLRQYYELTKPGIIYANVITAVAGYLFGSKWHVELSSFFGVIFGTASVIAAACVYNNILDRRIDKYMTRTRNRALVTGVISVPNASGFAVGLTVFGFGLLLCFTNLTVVSIGFVGLFDYVVAYGWAKRHTTLSTIIGSISGSTSIIAGYCAATTMFSTEAMMLFLILTLWQMPHFYAIAMYRKADYTAVHLPLMPLRRSAAIAKARILSYIAALIVVSALITLWKYAGVTCLVILLSLNLTWFAIGLKKYNLPAAAWGKQMFLFSLVVNLGISLAVAIGSVAP